MNGSKLQFFQTQKFFALFMNRVIKIIIVTELTQLSNCD